jgi:CheY-like chemotaxis protein
MTVNKHYKKVLVVDDNEIDRYIAQRNIIKSGFADSVVLKESASIALQYLESLKDIPAELPELIFLDVRMPEIDGFGFLEAYDQLPEVIKSSCIVMLLSTSLNPDDHERANSNKYVKRFLNKPLTKEELDNIHAAD